MIKQANKVEWADEILAEALCNNKTRLKEIRADDTLQIAVTEAIVTLAKAKTEAYNKARPGHPGITPAADAQFGWINKEPVLAQALRTLDSVGVSAGDVPMLPAAMLPKPQALKPNTDHVIATEALQGCLF